MKRDPNCLAAVLSVSLLLAVQVAGFCQRDVGLEPAGPNGAAPLTIPEIVMLPCSLGANQLLIARLVGLAEKARCPLAQIHFRTTSEGGGWGLMGGRTGLGPGGVVRVREDYLTGEGWPNRISLMVAPEYAPALADALAAHLGRPPTVTFSPAQPQAWVLDAMFVLPTWGMLGPAGMSIEVYAAGNAVLPQVQDFLKRFPPAAVGPPGGPGAPAAPAVPPATPGAVAPPANP